MGEIQTPQPVKFIAGLLLPGEGQCEAMCGELERICGPVDLLSPAIPFTFTDYYANEMGPLVRAYVSFEPLRAPDMLAEIKCASNAMEERRRRTDGGRSVNIDPGYLSLSQLVLASTKPFSHRVYLEQGIYAEVTLQYRDGSFQPLPWTYPDYKAHIPLFNEWRLRLKEQLRELVSPQENEIESTAG